MCCLDISAEGVENFGLAKGLMRLAGSHVYLTRTDNLIDFHFEHLHKLQMRVKISLLENSTSLISNCPSQIECGLCSSLAVSCFVPQFSLNCPPNICGIIQNVPFHEVFLVRSVVHGKVRFTFGWETGYHSIFNCMSA
jgi:hypothetical protein